MDTATFLKTILPEQGVLFVARLRANKGSFIHTPAANFTEAAEVALEQNEHYPNDNIYYAMASYKEVIMKTTNGFEYPSGRTQANVLNVKCLWQDWDVGKDNTNSYATRQDALDSLKTYISATGLPAPVIISSGYGLHTYWVFDEEVPASLWNDIAQYQRIVMRHLGVKFDPSRDKDCASVLRPVGCHNRKAGMEDKLVKAVRAEVNTLPAMEYKRLLQRYCNEHGLSSLIKAPASAVPEWMQGSEGNLDDIKPDFAKSYATIAVQHCKQIAEFSENGGEHEPLWYANLGVLKHMEDGQHYAHVWSSQYQGYDEDTTQQKYEQWNTGPTTCDKFKELNPTACVGCKHKCKSPVQLGVQEETKAPEVDVVSNGDETAPRVAAPLAGWPTGFVYNEETKTTYASIRNADGVIQQVPMATPLFYPVDTLFTEDGTYAFRMHMLVRGAIREFIMPTKHVANARSLKESLAANQIHVMHDKACVDFSSRYMTNMLHLREEVNTYTQFGWHHDYKGFLVGNTLVTEGEERPVLLGEALSHKDFRGMQDTSGTVEEWATGVDTLYNRPNAEPYQLAICNAFGSILNPLLASSMWNGIPYVMTSRTTGVGKSTCNMIGLSIYAKQEPNKLVVAKASVRAITIRASQMNHIPFLLDEVTNYLSDPADFASVAYDLSNGGGKLAATQFGKQRARDEGWCLSIPMTSNQHMNTQLRSIKDSAEATQARIFEVYLDDYPLMDTMREGTQAFAENYGVHTALSEKLITSCYGTVGRAWVRFIMANKDEIEAKILEVSTNLIAKHRMSGGEAAKERFYYNWIAVTLVAAAYAKELGFIKFDVRHLKKWLVAHVAHLRENSKSTRDTPEDHFSALMGSLVDKLIITRNFDTLDSRANKAEIPAPAPRRTPICGRLVTGDDKERPKLYVTTKAVSEWCFENQVPYSKFREDMLRLGIIRLGTLGVNRGTGTVRVAIGKGAHGYMHMGNPSCFEFNADTVGVLANPAPAEVTNLVAVS